MEVSCRVLVETEGHLRHVVDAVDAVVGNLGPIPAPVEAMLFQHDNQEQGNAVMAFTASIHSPRIGITLIIPENSSLSSLQERIFDTLECRFSEVNFQLGTSGTLSFSLSEIVLSA